MTHPADADLSAFLDAAAQRMGADGSAVTTQMMAGAAVVVGYQSRFRLRWFATRLHTFVVVAALQSATAEALHELTVQAIGYATQQKGRLRGLQSGVAVVPVIVTQAASDELRAAATNRPGRRYAVVVLPAVVDASSRACYVPDTRRLWGRIYMPWLRDRLTAAVGRPIEQSA